MSEWLKRTAYIRRNGTEKKEVESFRYVRKIVAGESRLYLQRFNDTYIPESSIGRMLMTPSEHDTIITYKWEFDTPVSSNVSIDP